MAEHLNLRALCIMMAAGLACVGACHAADLLSDPTRPPAVFLTSQDPAAAAIDAGPVLHSVMISKKRKLAVISGQEVALGGMWGESKLVAVRDHEVDLRNPDGSLQTLQMYSGVTKTVIEVKKKAPAKAGGVRQP